MTVKQRLARDSRGVVDLDDYLRTTGPVSKVSTSLEASRAQLLGRLEKKGLYRQQPAAFSSIRADGSTLVGVSAQFKFVFTIFFGFGPVQSRYEAKEPEKNSLEIFNFASLSTENSNRLLLAYAVKSDQDSHCLSFTLIDDKQQKDFKSYSLADSISRLEVVRLSSLAQDGYDKLLVVAYSSDSLQIHLILLTYHQGQTRTESLKTIENVHNFGIVSPPSNFWDRYEIYLIFDLIGDTQNLIIQPISRLGMNLPKALQFFSLLPVSSFIVRIHNETSFYLFTETNSAFFEEYLIKIEDEVTLLTKAEYQKMPGYDSLSIDGTSQYIIVKGQKTASNQQSSCTYFFYDRKPSSIPINPS